MHAQPLPAPAPVRCAADALHLLSVAVARPLRHETLAFLLDDHGVGGVIVVVDGTVAPDALLDVVEVMVRTGERLAHVTSLVVATVRPDAGALPGDVDRWLEASSIAAAGGLALLEWFLIGPRGVECPRDLLGEPQRWPA